MTEGRHTWGQGIRSLRSIRQMTQDELAAASRVSQATISRLENGSFLASDATRVRIAKALKVDPNVLFPYVDLAESEAAS